MAKKEKSKAGNSIQDLEGRRNTHCPQLNYLVT